MYSDIGAGVGSAAGAGAGFAGQQQAISSNEKQQALNRKAQYDFEE